MTTRVVPVSPVAAPGRSVYVEGRPALVLYVLPRVEDRPLTARVTHAPPCRLCEAPLTWDRTGWRCPKCDDTPTAEDLEDWCREHVADGVRAGNARRDRDRRARQVARGAPGAAAVLRHEAATGGAPSRAYLADRRRLTGDERRALRWALRDDGDRPLSADRCREAAVELESHAAARRHGLRADRGAPGRGYRLAPRERPARRCPVRRVGPRRDRVRRPLPLPSWRPGVPGSGLVLGLPGVRVARHGCRVARPADRRVHGARLLPSAPRTRAVRGLLRTMAADPAAPPSRQSRMGAAPGGEAAAERCRPAGLATSAKSAPGGLSSTPGARA